ncbi:MAG TPA: hypothetical protein VN748_14425 [Pseudonocardiaceae bacterium]|nr:hypothetical protein [Pseudonocardiaceae bacterium]
MAKIQRVGTGPARVGTAAGFHNGSTCASRRRPGPPQPIGCAQPHLTSDHSAKLDAATAAALFSSDYLVLLVGPARSIAVVASQVA